METTDKKRDSSLLSYHTFIYPFALNSDEVHKKFEAMLEKSKFWSEEVLDGNYMPEKKEYRKQNRGFGEYEKDWYLTYQSGQYFNDSAKKLIFGVKTDNNDKDHVVKNYILRPNKQSIRGKSKYIIKRSYTSEDNGRRASTTEEFILSVNRIRLKLYSTGSAFIVFDMEYCGEKYLTRTKKPTLGLWRGTRTKKPTQKKRPRRIPREVARRRGTRIKKLARDRSLDAVNKINHDGRRVKFPYFEPSGYPSIMADSVELNIGIFKDGKQLIPPIKESFREWHKKKQEKFVAYEKTWNTESSTLGISIPGVFEPILELLNLDNDKADALTDKDIRSLIDDRMLVCSLLLYPELLGRINEWDPKIAEYRYLSDCDIYDKDMPPGYENVSTNLYTFAFIETWPSCMSHAMRKKLLHESVYDRWIDYSTIYVATNHSFVAAHAAKEFYLVRNFLHLYIEMFLIALIQRATLLALSSEASSIAGKLNPKNPESLEKALPEISDLYKEYVKVNSQMMLTEVTSQEQGIEMYELFLKQLYIEKHKQALDQQLNNLYEVSNIESNTMQQRADAKLQSVLRVLTYAGLFLAMLGLFPFVSGAYSGESLGSYTDISHMLGVISAVLLAVIAYWGVSQDKAPKK